MAMRPRKAGVALILLAAALGAACSRSVGGVKSVEQVAPDYHVRDSAATRERLAMQEKLGLAMNRIQAGDYDAAEQYVREVLRKTSGQPDPYTLMALIEGHRGNTVAAGENYRKAAELAPQQGDVLNNYGAWLCGNGYPAEALVWFDRAMADPRYGSPPAVLANSGGCALQVGQAERGLRDLRKALELEPGNAYALESMARYQYDHGRYFEARAFSERRLAAAPATVSVLKLAIQIESGLGDKAAAGRYQQRLEKELAEQATANPGAKAL